MNAKPALWYAVLVIMALLIALAGYAGYALYPRFDLPSVSGASLLLLAAGAGIASFFTPCSFPLLTTLLARAIDTNKIRHPIGQSLRYGTALAAGASVFLLLTGAGIALGGGTLFEQVTFTSSAGRILRFVLGSLLVLFGSVQIGWLSLPFGKVTSLAIPIRKFQITIRDEHPTPGFFIFGFAYILAGFG